MKIPFKRALLSVYDKTGIVELAQVLAENDCEIISTGSTAETLERAGISVTKVADITDFPECFDGRVKTLHPRIHGGILANRQLSTHLEELARLDITPIDLVVVNLYPFSQTVAAGGNVAQCVEQIDIGGPTMIRAAAKNYASVAVVVNPLQYAEVITAVGAGGFTLAQRSELAVTAFTHTAQYDLAVASWTASVLTTEQNFIFPSVTGNIYERATTLRYGENPHQQAALYRQMNACGGVANAQQLGGKEMSYNNYQDIDAAVRAAYDHTQPAVAVIKHANPCGVAVGENIAQAHLKAHACDPQSAYGGVIAANREVSLVMAEQIKPIFTEVIAAPAYEHSALELLRTKKNLRILQVEPEWAELETKEISGGILRQKRDTITATGDPSVNWELVAGSPADTQTLRDLEFAWTAVRAVRSNAILLAKNEATVGIGMGQVNRVDACRLAVERANTLATDSVGNAVNRACGAVAASDAFFPFADGLQILLAAGVKAVVQPGGSIRDAEVIQAAQEAGITMYFTRVRHFAH